MKIFEFIERFELIYKLIKEERTGSANKFAKEIGISRNQLYNYIDHFKAYGIKIRYDLYKSSYIMKDSVELEIQHPIETLENNQLTGTEGGGFRISHLSRSKIRL